MSLALQGVSHLDIIYESLQDLGGQLDIYELLAGNTSDYNITYPAFYITNISNSSINAEIILHTVQNYTSLLENTVFTKDSFVGGVVAFCFVICGIVTATWMFLLLLVFSTNSVPNSLILVTLFSCCTYTVALSRLTDILEFQITSNFTNMDEISTQITFSKDMVIVRGILLLLNYICWVDLIIQMNKFHHRRKTLVIGLLLGVISFVFSLTFNMLNSEIEVGKSTPSPPYYGFRYGNWIIEIIILVVFLFEVLYYAKQKLKFVIHRKTLPLTIFTLLTMVSPLVFQLMVISSKVLKNWAFYVLSFARLSCAIVLWEWLHSVRTLELKHEKKTILGRRISNDSFSKDSKIKRLGSKKARRSTETGANSSSVTVNNSYILKSTNFLSFVDGIWKIKPWIQEKLAKRTNNNRKKSSKDVQMYEMQPIQSRRSNISNISHEITDEEDDFSYIDNNHPLFEVDHRYLRNTPSTAHNSRRNTPNVPAPEDDDDDNDNQLGDNHLGGNQDNEYPSK